MTLVEMFKAAVAAADAEGRCHHLWRFSQVCARCGEPAPVELHGQIALGWSGDHECKVVPGAPRCSEACGCFPAPADEEGGA